MMDMEKRPERGTGKNRRCKAGETLTETLITMLIIGLSSVLFLTMTGAAGRIFRRAELEYGKIYEIISGADVQADSGSGAPSLSDSDNIGKISVIGTETTVELKVNWYGSTDYVLSYKAR